MSKGNDIDDAINLQKLLIDHATGNFQDENAYSKLRKTLLSNMDICKLIPEFVVNQRTLTQFWHYIKSEHEHYKDRREFIYNSFLPLLNKLEDNHDFITIYEPYFNDFKLDRVETEFKKCFERSTSDPEGAITSARALLESTCKHILDGAQVNYEDTDDLPSIYKKAAFKIRLAPEQHKEKVFKQALQGCVTAVEGLSSMRNAYSDSHGKSQRTIIPKERHARLAVGLACSVSLFLLQTLNDNGYYSNEPIK